MLWVVVCMCNGLELPILGVFVNVIIDYDSYNVMLMIDGQIDALMRIDCV